MNLEGIPGVGKRRFDGTGCLGSAGDTDREVSRLEPSLRPCEQGQHERDHGRYEEHRREMPMVRRVSVHRVKTTLYRVETITFPCDVKTGASTKPRATRGREAGRWDGFRSPHVSVL